MNKEQKFKPKSIKELLHNAHVIEYLWREFWKDNPKMIKHPAVVSTKAMA